MSFQLFIALGLWGFINLTAVQLTAAQGPAPAPTPSCEELPQKSQAELWTKAECFHKRQDLESAIKILKVIVERHPRDLEASFTSSWLLWRSASNLKDEAAQKRKNEALAELERAWLNNPTHWDAWVELGDFYFLRLGEPEKAYPKYLESRKFYGGDYAKKVPEASAGRKAAIENRIARTAEVLDRSGEAVEASCRALYFDPDDKSALNRIKKLNGSCEKKNVKDPR